MKLSTRCIAIYVRVSSRRQDFRSQVPDLERWAESFAGEERVKWYREAVSGKSMDRPAWKRLEGDMHSGKISKLVVWRIDRLGRTAAGLTALFETLQRLGVGFESVRDRIDLGTASGRLMAHVLASVAVYENEVRSERIRAGQEAAKAQGKRWGGSRPGQRRKVTSDHEDVIRHLHGEGQPISRIAKVVGVSRPTIYSVLRQQQN